MAITDELRDIPIWVWPAGGAVLLGITLLSRRSAPAATSPVDPLATPGSLTPPPDPNAGTGGVDPGALADFESQITDLLSQQSADNAAALTAAQKANADANASLAKQIADQAAAFAKSIADVIGRLPVSTPNPPSSPPPPSSSDSGSGTGFSLPGWLVGLVTGKTVAGYNSDHTLPADLSQIGVDAKSGFFRFANGKELSPGWWTPVNIRGKTIYLPIGYTGQGANAQDTINQIVGRLNAIADGKYGWGVTGGSASDPRNIFIIVRSVIEDQLHAGKSLDSLGLHFGSWFLAGS